MPRSSTRFDLSTAVPDDVDEYLADDVDDYLDEYVDDSDDSLDDYLEPESFEKFRSNHRNHRDQSTSRAPRLAVEGKSGRRAAEEAEPAGVQTDDEPVDTPLDVRYTTYDASMHGPQPIPDWVVTSFSAVDTQLGILKTGKEADVHLLDRSLPDGQTSFLAVKTYRSSDHRMFHRDAGYQEGRRIRRSRETRAMATRTAFGRELLAGKWAFAEFESLGRLWSAGANVPYPVQLIGSELMMQFIGEPDGTAAPRLAAAVAEGDSIEYFTDLWHDLIGTLALMADLGFTHGDLSPYNVLVQNGRCVLIDLPQVVDVIGNPQGVAFLTRDVANICEFFRRRGVLAADADLVTTTLVDRAGL